MTENQGRIEIDINRIMETVKAADLGEIMNGMRGEMIEDKVHGDL